MSALTGPGMIEGPRIGCFKAHEAIAPYLRVKHHSTIGEVAIAGDEACIGVSLLRSYADQDPMTVYDIRAAGTIDFVANGAITAGDSVSSAAAGKVQTGTGGVQYLGKALSTTTADGERITIMPDPGLAGSISRGSLVQQDGVIYTKSLGGLQATGTGAALGATAGTPSGALGLTVGTFGTNTPKVVGEAASGNSKTDKARFQFVLPAEYVSGQGIAVRVRCKEAVGAATVATSIDCECYKSDNAAGLGSDLCSTAAQDVTPTIGNKDFTITPTSLAAGDTLDIQLTGVTNDTGGTVGTILEIDQVAMLLSVKG